MKYILIKDQGRLAFFDENDIRHIITAKGDFNPDTMQSRFRCFDNTTGKEVILIIEDSNWYAQFTELP